ncbi:MAG TPA: OpgC domain-containing protein [Candidatus Tectomicrobia bacterium]
MSGIIHYGTEYVKMIIPRLWPTRSWCYSGGKRDLRLDLLRGFAVLAMVADHIGGERSWLYAITGGDAFFVSAAEVFVFISGLLMGMIYAGVIARQGLGAALMKSLQRAWTLYLMTVTLTLTFMILSAQLGLGWDSEMSGATWSDLLVSVLTLHRTFYLTDILLLYTLLVLAAVPVLVLLVHTQTALVLAGSWGLWMLWQLAPQHAQFPWSIVGNSVFNFPAWQALFVTAIVIGYHRQRLEQHLAQISEHLVLGISGTFVAAVIGIYVIVFLESSSPHGMLVEHLFGKVDLRIGRLLVFAGFFIFAFGLVTFAWAPIRRALGWLLLPLGQDALSAYILHLFVAALAVKVKPLVFTTSPATPMEHTICQLVGIAFIWMAIMLRPIALTQLHTGFTRATALLATGRAYLYSPGHPNRDI